MFFRHVCTISEEGSRCILSESGLPISSSADYQELHTVSATCSYTVTFITVHTNKLSLCFVLFISRRYQRLTMYSVQCDCRTTKWTRFVRHEVLSAVFQGLKVSCLLYRVDRLAIKLTDFSE